MSFAEYSLRLVWTANGRIAAVPSRHSSLATRHFSVKPGSGGVPLALDRTVRNLHRRGRLLDREPAEESQLNDSDWVISRGGDFAICLLRPDHGIGQCPPL